jgi:hypothetical protein
MFNNFVEATSKAHKGSIVDNLKPFSPYGQKKIQLFTQIFDLDILVTCLLLNLSRLIFQKFITHLGLCNGRSF